MEQCVRASSNPATHGTCQSILIRGVASFQGYLKAYVTFWSGHEHTRWPRSRLEGVHCSYISLDILLILTSCMFSHVDLGSSSPPLNLSFTLTPIAHRRVALRLQWSLSEDEEGTRSPSYYQISLNHVTGEHFLEMRAVNCAGVSPTATG